jgi:hypothetical protein
MDQKKDHLQTNIVRPDFSICLANSFLFPSSSCSFGVNGDKSLSACGVSFAPQKIFPSPFLHRHYLSGGKKIEDMWKHAFLFWSEKRNFVGRTPTQRPPLAAPSQISASGGYFHFRQLQ